MVTPKYSRLFIIMVLCLTMPIRQLFAAMPEINPFSMNRVEMSVSQPVQAQLDLTQIHFVEYDPVIADSKVIDAILGGEDEEAIITGIPNGLTFENAEEKLQDDLLIPGQERGSNRKKLVIGLAVLLAASLITALFAFLAGSGSGAGSGSAAGGGGNGGPSNSNPSSASNDGGTIENGGPGGGDPQSDIFGPLFPPTDPTKGGGDTDPFNPNQQLQLLNNFQPYSVPNNPEPATMLLTLLGLAMPFLRKRFFHE